MFCSTGPINKTVCGLVENKQECSTQSNKEVSPSLMFTDKAGNTQESYSPHSQRFRADMHLHAQMH